MDYVGLVLKVLGAGLSIWESKEKSRYIERFIKIKEDYYEESSKDRPDRASLDNLEHKLYILSEAFDSEIKRQAASN